jgi:hypothetical protein
MMLRASCFRVLLAVWCQLAVAQVVVAQTVEPQSPREVQCDSTDAAFAAQLMAEQDYFRAITVYKHLAFTAPDLPTARAYRLHVAYAYTLSGRHENAIYELTALYNSKGASDVERDGLRLKLSASYLAMRLPSVAAPFLDAPTVPALMDERTLLLAMADIHTEQLARAKRSLVALSASAGDFKPAAQRLTLAVDGYEHASHRSPWLAGMLSALVPGAGQLYTGHPVDAVQAFVFVGAFGFSTYLAYSYDRTEHNPYVLTGSAALIALAFHIANIIGATRTAQFHNLKQREALLDATTQEVFALPP